MKPLSVNKQPCWHYQAASSPEKAILKSRGEPQHITSGVLRAAHDTATSANLSARVLDDSYRFASDYLERVKTANPQNSESLIDDFKSRTKVYAAAAAQACAKAAGKAGSFLLSNPTLPTALSGIFIGALLSGDPIKWADFYQSDQLKALIEFSRELIELESLAKTHPDLFQTPMDAAKTASWHFDDTVKTFGNGVNAILVGTAIKFASVFTNTMNTVAAEQQISVMAQKAFGFESTDTQLAVIKKIAMDTDRLRAIFVSSEKPSKYLGNDWQERHGESRELYREAIVHELLCVLGRDNQIVEQINQAEKSVTGETLNVSALPLPLRERMIQFIGVAMYGENVLLMNWNELESVVNIKANTFYAADQLAVINIQNRHDSKESVIAPKEVNKDEMYKQLYDVRQMLGAEMEHGLQLKQALDESTQPAM
jgi:hypothetical protein